MALLEINLRPGERDLRWFGVVMLAFCALLALIALRAFDAPLAAVVLTALGVVLCALYYLVRPLRRLMYVGWMRAVFPVGWVLSHLLMGLIYFVVLTPIGLALRLSGRDPLALRRRDRPATYWVEREREADAEHYFRQF